MDKAYSVKESDDGASASGVDNSGTEEPDIHGRTSISSDDSICSSLPSEEFYYFYQGEVVFLIGNVHYVRAVVCMVK